MKRIFPPFFNKRLSVLSLGFPFSKEKASSWEILSTWLDGHFNNIFDFFPNH